jgi:crotonobetainyl-CoA:carnitine CoA-transferase CaiB-like acyl-CoA transferase
LSTTGILPLMGDPKNIPEVPRVQLGDIAAGGMNAASGILLALHAREKTGSEQNRRMNGKKS